MKAGLDMLVPQNMQMRAVAFVAALFVSSRVTPWFKIASPATTRRPRQAWSGGKPSTKTGRSFTRTKEQKNTGRFSTQHYQGPRLVSCHAKRS